MVNNFFIYIIMVLKAKSFSDFQKLALKGQICLLTFGQYSHKTRGISNKYKRRKVISYFYKNLLK